MTSHAAIRRLLLVAACIASGGLVPATAGAQPSIAAAIDTDQVHIGDPIHLSLQVRGLAASQRVLFPDQFDEVLPQPAAARRLPAADGAAAASYDVRLFKLGDATIGPLPVQVVDGLDTLTLQTAPLQLSVIALRQEGETDLRQIKPPLAISGGIPIWLVAMLVATALAALAWLAYRFILRRTAPTAAPAPVAPTDFNREFARIESMGLLERGAVKLYYTHLSDVLRRLLEERLQIEGLERTTEEIARDAHHHPMVPAELHRKIVDFLSAADLVKFARAEPPLSEARQMPSQGREILRQIEAQLQAAAVADAAEDAATARAQVEV